MFEILLPEIQKFIRDHENDDEKKLILKYKSIHGISASLIAQQIAARRKSKEKLPLYYITPGIVFPPAINLEQSSSQQTAEFKSHVIEYIISPRRRMVDLTGGFGIDTFFFSKIFSYVDFVEPNESLLKIAAHNHNQLGSSNINYHRVSAEAFLAKPQNQFDLVYLDPSRRTEKQKVYSLDQSEPNAATLLPKIFALTQHVLLKASPMLDIEVGLTTLTNTKKIYVIAVNNECKELVFLCEKDYNKEASIEAANIDAHGTNRFEFQLSGEKSLSVVFEDPKQFLYEPNAAIMKAGAFKSVGKRFGLFKIHPSTHLYTSSDLVQDFPGKVFKVDALIKPDSKMISSFFPEGKANVTTRNYPLTPDQLKKKTGLKDGGEKFLIGFSGVKEKFLAAAERLK